MGNSWAENREKERKENEKLQVLPNEHERLKAVQELQRMNYVKRAQRSTVIKDS